MLGHGREKLKLPEWEALAEVSVHHCLELNTPPFSVYMHVLSFRSPDLFLGEVAVRILVSLSTGNSFEVGLRRARL
jgi:hypothetical protein